MQVTNYLAWSLLLITQNISFTYVSRARNSGSLSRHVKAAILSNGIWIVSSMVMLGPMLDQITGKKGFLLQALAGVVYTAATVFGGVIAHYWALRTEKGKNAVGANKKYAQVPVEDWARVQEIVADYDRLKNIAETAYACSVDALPVAATASKIAGATITTQS